MLAWKTVDVVCIIVHVYCCRERYVERFVGKEFWHRRMLWAHFHFATTLLEG